MLCKAPVDVSIVVHPIQLSITQKSLDSKLIPSPVSFYVQKLFLFNLFIFLFLTENVVFAVAKTSREGTGGAQVTNNIHSSNEFVSRACCRPTTLQPSEC